MVELRLLRQLGQRCLVRLLRLAHLLGLPGLLLQLSLLGEARLLRYPCLFRLLLRRELRLLSLLRLPLRELSLLSLLRLRLVRRRRRRKLCRLVALVHEILGLRVARHEAGTARARSERLLRRRSGLVGRRPRIGRDVFEVE